MVLGQQYNTGEKPTVVLYTYINRHAGTPDKNKTKTCWVHNKIGLKLLYTVIIVPSAFPYTTRACSLEHRQCYNIVICKDK